MTSDPRAARVIVHTGKGGVGKTSVAAATAVRLASGGQRTLVASTDVAHSLADVLDHPLGDRPTPVRTDLDAQQLSPDQRLRSGWRDIGEYLRAMLTWGGADPLESAELAVLPGLDEVTRAEVARSVHRVVQTLLHAPTVRVKQLAERPGGDAYADALRELFDLDPAATAAVASVSLPTEGGSA